jgi:hypothetical protein
MHEASPSILLLHPLYLITGIIQDILVLEVHADKDEMPDYDEDSRIFD